MNDQIRSLGDSQQMEITLSNQPTMFSSLVHSLIMIGRKYGKPRLNQNVDFFCWLLLQRKILTSDKIIRRGGQADPICKLCTTETESLKHLVAECSFSRMVWSLLAQKFNLPVINQSTSTTKIKTWCLPWLDQTKERQPQTAPR